MGQDLSDTDSNNGNDDSGEESDAGSEKIIDRSRLPYTATPAPVTNPATRPPRQERRPIRFNPHRKRHEGYQILNLTHNYGLKSGWGPSQGLRELIQNLYPPSEQG